MANVAQLNLIQINNFPEVENPSEWIVVSDAAGTAYKISKDNFKAFLGTVTVSTPKPIGPTDVTPELDGVYIPTVVGVYPNFGGLERLESDGYVQFLKNGAVFAKVNTEMPMQDLSDLATKEEISPLLGIINTSPQLSPNIFFKDYFFNGTGNISPSVNWIRTDRIIVQNSWKGEQATVSGFGYAPSGGARVLIRDINGVVLLSIPGAGNDLTPVTFTIPDEAHDIGFSLVNFGGIGNNPNDNVYKTSFMFNLGTEALPYAPMGGSVKVEAIDYDVAGMDQQNFDAIDNLDTKVESVLSESYNLINYITQFESGTYGSLGNPSASNNQIRVKEITIPADWIGKTFTYQGFGYLAEGGFARVSIFSSTDENLLLIYSKGTDLTPETFTIPEGSAKLRLAIANVIGIGLTPLDNEFTTSVMLSQGEEVRPFFPYGLALDGNRIINLDLDSLSTQDVILTKTTNTSFNLYYFVGNNWFRTKWIRLINPTKFIDTWRLDEGYLCTRTSEFGFVDILQVVLSGVWENAMYIVSASGAGYTDALGSAHGWEVLEDFSFFMDGEYIDPTSATTQWKGRHFYATQRSYFKTSDGLGNIGISLKRWDVKDAEITIENTIDLLGSLDISQDSYLGMISVIRERSGQQVTHSAFSNDSYVVYDVSVPGFTTPIFADRFNPKRTSITIWGDQVKIELEVAEKRVTLANGDILIDGLSNSGMYVQNSALYNKIYASFGNILGQNGDRLRVRNIYRIGG